MYISTSTYVDVCMDSKHQRIVKLLLTVLVHSLVQLQLDAFHKQLRLVLTIN